MNRRGFLEACVAGAAGLGIVGCGSPSRDDVVRDQYSEIRAVIGEDYKPDYHPDITDYEKQLEQEISPWLPNYIEFEKGFQGTSGILRVKANHIRRNPEIVEDNDHYERFTNYLDEHYKDQGNGSFLGLGISLKNITNDPKMMEKTNQRLSKDFGFTIDLKNPSRADKAMLFLAYLHDGEWKKVPKLYNSFPRDI